MTVVSASSWPLLAERRGAIAASLLLVLMCGLQVDMSLLLSLLPAWEWLTSSWGWAAVLAAPGFLVLPLLGPGAWRKALGGRPSAFAMLIGLGLGTADALLSLAYGTFAHSSRPLDASAPGSDEMAMCITGILVTPLVEEWLFRGVLWVAVRQWLGTGWAVVLTSAVFAVGHGMDRAVDFPTLFVFGAFLGLLRHQSQSLAPVVLAHSLTNFLIYLLGPLLR